MRDGILNLSTESGQVQTAKINSAVPRVGVGVIVLRAGLVLLGRRIGSHGAGTWALPGGHLEFGESVEQCARREVREETGLELERLSPGPYTNDLFASEGKHYVTLFVVSHSLAGEPEVREPAKCARWQWFAWSSLPEPLFQPLSTLRRAGFVPASAA
jgi:8-oxo-dGTP diphosphatase